MLAALFLMLCLKLFQYATSKVMCCLYEVVILVRVVLLMYFFSFYFAHFQTAVTRRHSRSLSTGSIKGEATIMWANIQDIVPTTWADIALLTAATLLCASVWMVCLSIPSCC